MEDGLVHSSAEHCDYVTSSPSLETHIKTCSHPLGQGDVIFPLFKHRVTHEKGEKEVKGGEKNPV